MIRGNQAGEYGATCLYAGKKRILKNNATMDHMAAQEKEHLCLFNDLALKQSVQPTVFQPLWHIAGKGLGMFSAMMGEKAAHTCTMAVEEVIIAHYQSQLDELAFFEQTQSVRELENHIQKCQSDEMSHKDEAIALGATDHALATPLATLTKLATKGAIWLSQKI